MKRLERVVDGFWGIQKLLDDLKEQVELVLDSGESAVVHIVVDSEKT